MSLQMIEPEGFPVLATTKVAAVLAIADNAAPSVDEINAATSLDLSLFLNGLPAEITTNTGTRPARLGSSVDLGRDGRTQIPAFTVRYPYDPQDVDNTTPNNKAKAMLVRGQRLWVVVRKGPAVEIPFDVDDVVEQWAVRCGIQTRPNDGDEYADNEISQVLTPTRQPIYDRKLVA